MVAAAVVLMTPEKAKPAWSQALVYVKSFGIAGADPTLTYPAVPIAVNKALKRAGLTIGPNRPYRDSRSLLLSKP